MSESRSAGKMSSAKSGAFLSGKWSKISGLERVDHAVGLVRERLGRVGLLLKALNAAVGAGDDDAVLAGVRDPLHGESRDAVVGRVSIGEAAEVEVGERIAGHDQERLVAEPVAHVSHASGGAEELLLLRVGEVHPQVRSVAEPVGDRLGKPVEVRDDVGDAVAGQRAQDQLDHGPVCHGHHRLRHLVCERTQARAQPCRHHHRLHQRQATQGEAFAGTLRCSEQAANEPSRETHDDYRHRDHHRGLQGRRRRPGRVRPQGDHACRARDARPHAHARGIRRLPAAQGRSGHGFAPHDSPDGGADRDAYRARRRGPLGLVQHLLDAGSRRRRDRGRRGSRLRLEGRDPRGVLVVHRAGAHVARRRRPEHDPRRRWRRDASRPQGRRVRGRGRGSRPRRRRLGGDADHPRDAPALPRSRLRSLHAHGARDHGRDRGDHDGRPSPVRVRARRQAVVPGDQRERLGHEVEVRQPLRLPALADRRDQPRHRRHDRRQGRRHLRLRRRRQGLRRVAPRPGRPRDHHRDRPDLRASGVDGGLRGTHARGGRRVGGHLHHRHRQQGRHHRRPDGRG